MFSNVALCKVQEWPQIFFHVNMFTYTWNFKNKTSCSIQWAKHYVADFRRFFSSSDQQAFASGRWSVLKPRHDWFWFFFFHWYIYFLFLAVAAEFSSQNRTKGSYFLGLEHLGVGRGLRNFSVHMGSQIWRSIWFGNDGYDCINTWKPNFFAILQWYLANERAQPSRIHFAIRISFQFWTCWLQFYKHQIIRNASFLRCGWLNRIFFWKVLGWRWYRTFLPAGGVGAVFLGCSLVFWFLYKPCFWRLKTVMPIPSLYSFLAGAAFVTLFRISSWKLGIASKKLGKLISYRCQGCIYWEICFWSLLAVVLILVLVLVVAMFVAEMKGFLQFIHVWWFPTWLEPIKWVQPGSFTFFKKVLSRGRCSGKQESFQALKGIIHNIILSYGRDHISKVFFLGVAQWSTQEPSGVLPLNPVMATPLPDVTRFEVEHS